MIVPKDLIVLKDLLVMKKKGFINYWRKINYSFLNVAMVSFPATKCK